jgi:NAD(P)-dependent dehydrogenase (short-subunit alcohol dehydrogenase family)
MTRSHGERWDAERVEDQSGRTFVITGANSGIGLEATRVLARRGATVVMACRNLEKADRVCSSILAEVPGANLPLVALDLSDLDSVRGATDKILADHAQIDVLINNAGIMAIPRQETAQGFEMQLGTNHLGHFAFTGLLMERLLSCGAKRVVTISSQAHRMGQIYFDDLQLQRGYGEWKAYGQSKLANLLFAFELDRKLRAGGHVTISVAAHPGYANTDLQHVGPRTKGNRLMERVMGALNEMVAQSAADGALPTLRAAVDPEVSGGDYFGPGGFMETAGPPVKVRTNAAARDEEVAARLWSESERLTGIRFPL